MEALPNVPGEHFPVPEDAVLLPVDGQWLGFRRSNAPLEGVPDLAEDEPLPPFGLDLPVAAAPKETPPL